ncbi:MAG: ATP-binding cassette family protein [Gloeocapsa sp. DLM2.Bin57]|nr:MAG: ATP-binding cassette family protein [Gloeocapsa sp. DLM2.Bin57]
MIPRQLTLKNFLSYQQATLDFRGLHTACICGVNGAGKSSLLEAITWAIWGKTRAGSNDDVIHTGATEVRVDFEFSFAENTYRVIRTRQRGSRSDLQFQIYTPKGFSPITKKGITAGQEEINKHIKLDYDTFINSAYLRQGRADEFMLLRPGKRKEVLANLLKLEQYEELEEKAKNKANQYKQERERIAAELEQIKQKIATKPDILHRIESITTEIEETQLTISQIQQQLDLLKEKKHTRQRLLDELKIKQQVFRDSQQQSDRLTKEYQNTLKQLTELENLLQQESTITTNYQELLNLKTQERNLRDKSQQHQRLQQQKQQLEQQIQQQRHQLELNAQKLRTNLDNLNQEEQEIKQILSNLDSITQQVQELQHYRQRLRELDNLQQEVVPLKQRKDHLQIQIEREKAQLEASLTQLQQTVTKLSEELAKKTQQLAQLEQIEEQLEILQKKRTRLEWIKQKIQEQSNREVRLKERQETLKKELEKLSQKQDSLQHSEAICPLCEQNLGEHHLHQVINKTAQETEKIETEYWSIQEQIVQSQRERDNFNKELTTLEQDLIESSSLEQKYYQLENELDIQNKRYQERKQVLTKIELIEQSLEDKTYGESLFVELTEIEQQLAKLNYDEKTHSLIREKERGLGWVEKKQADIERAQKKQQEIEQLRPQILAQLAAIEREINTLVIDSPLQQQLEELLTKVTELNYNPVEYNQIVEAIDKADQWELLYQQLQQAQAKYPQKQTDLAEITQRQKEHQEKLVSFQQELTDLQTQINAIEDTTEPINHLDKEKDNKHKHLNHFLTEKGSLTEKQNQITIAEQEQIEKREKLKTLQKQQRIYDELIIAFGKKGIQSLMIENIIPYLEAQTNQILAKLTSNQLHVEFVTQKTNRTSDKINETLDINIHDSRGKRPYETYSGGEAFRINFAIRLALSKLLTQRSGTSLQLLVIDEGFGTQDQDGCDRLIAAINAIASEFACILTVTHMQQFKEAFQNHIEVYKTSEGSRLSLSS